MKLLMVLLLLFPYLTKVADNDYPDKEMDFIRANYIKAVSDKKLCKAMLVQLHTKNGNSVYLAYRGAFKTIWASHAINPIVKLNAFNKGKKDIENAVKENPDNIEIRFIRLSIQQNCPSFLGYNNEVEQDLQFIHENKNSITSTLLKNMIAKVVKKEIR
ncbi:hypothetical protein [Flavobacterium sp. CAU 1735]|uniref:hypothetical protein n=1 Tax=Flavobacterium sp. CAU 1735 TaxID=3140361 RepID=UPI003261B777